MNEIKAHLHKDYFKCIATATYSDFFKHINKDKVLAQYFAPVVIDSLPKKQTLAALKSVKNRYEIFYDIAITDQALEAAVELADHYIKEKALLGRATDIIDFAGAQLKWEINQKPEEIKILEKEIYKWGIEKDRAIAKHDFEEAAKFREKAMKLRRKRKEFIVHWRQNTEKNKKKLDVDAIYQAVSKITQISMDILQKSKKEYFLELEKKLYQMVGNCTGIKPIAQAIIRNQFTQKSGAMASFFCFGPEIIKFLLAQSLAKYIFYDINAVMKINLSTFSKQSDFSYLMAHSENTERAKMEMLIEKSWLNPCYVLLLTEIDLAKPEIIKLLMQIIKTGHWIDHLGNMVHFKNTLILAWSSKQIKDIDAYFGPELSEMFDEIVVFDKVTDENLARFLDLELDNLKRMLKIHGAALEITSKAKEFIIKEFKKTHLKLSMLKQNLNSLLINPICMGLLEGIYTNKVICVEQQEKELEIKTRD